VIFAIILTGKSDGARGICRDTIVGKGTEFASGWYYSMFRWAKHRKVYLEAISPYDYRHISIFVFFSACYFSWIKRTDDAFKEMHIVQICDEVAEIPRFSPYDMDSNFEELPICHIQRVLLASYIILVLSWRCTLLMDKMASP